MSGRLSFNPAATLASAAALMRRMRNFSAATETAADMQDTPHLQIPDETAVHDTRGEEYAAAVGAATLPPHTGRSLPAQPPSGTQPLSDANTTHVASMPYSARPTDPRKRKA